MAEKKHALLGPSSASRWLACTPSAVLETQFPDRGSEAAAEGTLAHDLGEYLIREALNLDADPNELKRIEADPLFNTDMWKHCCDYRDHVLGVYWEAKAKTPDAVIMLEEKLNLTEYVPEGFGTGDAVIMADGVLDIIDMKYGKGVAVSCYENKQMMLYALGALRNHHIAYGIENVRMTIYQPRLDNISTFEMFADELIWWGETELRNRAMMAFKGEGEFVAGAHCQFCKAKPRCRAFADHNLEIAKHEFKDADLLSPDEVSDILSRSSQFKNWIEAVSKYALLEAVQNGVEWPGYKLVEGRSVRKYTDEDAIATKAKALGASEDDIYTMKLVGITAMEKLLGKKVFEKEMTQWVVKPPGSPTLVPQSDKRPVFNGADAALVDFEGLIEVE